MRGSMTHSSIYEPQMGLIDGMLKNQFMKIGKGKYDETKARLLDWFTDYK